MFVQLIQGRVSDAGVLRAAMDRWQRDLAPSAEGWLGSTAGVTDDGRFVALARFESEEAARRNSDRAEQGEWWAQFAQGFAGEPEFLESTEVDVDLYGDPDQAGFVQVMQGRTSDPDRSRELMAQNPEAWSDWRPDVIGSVSALHDGGRYTVAIYFTSEAEAREGERKEVPEQLREQMEAMEAVEVGQPTFLDLEDPWLYSPS